MKKALSILLAIVMLMSFSVVSFAADSSKNGNLQFGEDGKFEILILADTQDGYPHRPDFINFLNQALDKTQPDLVIFLGDIVMSAVDGTDASYWKGYDELLNPLVERNIPFTLVFGNHDEETNPNSNKEEMLAKYQTYAGCLAYDADPALHGTATHNIEILSSDGSKTAYNLWMMDSGSYVFSEDGTEEYYDCVRADQIAWYEAESNALEEANGGLVPSMMFQHIIPAEVAKQVMITSSLPLGVGGKDLLDGTSLTYLPNMFGYQSGSVLEMPCPSLDCEGQWDSIVNRGDVQAVFFGHDHTNTFVADVDGVDAINVPGATYRSYQSFVDQGAMLVTLDESDLSTYKTELIRTADLALEEGSLLPEGDRSKAEYQFANVCKFLLEAVQKAIRFVGKTLFFWA